MCLKDKNQNMSGYMNIGKGKDLKSIKPIYLVGLLESHFQVLLLLFMKNSEPLLLL